MAIAGKSSNENSDISATVTTREELKDNIPAKKSVTGTAKDSETAECIGRGGCGKSFPCDQVGAEFTYSKLCKSCYQQKCKTVFYMLL